LGWGKAEKIDGKDAIDFALKVGKRIVERLGIKYGIIGVDVIVSRVSREGKIYLLEVNTGAVDFYNTFKATGISLAEAYLEVVKAILRW